MSNYSKTTDFEAKDSLPTGDSGKIIRGAEFETEFDAISTAIATKADTAGPTFTGTLTFETISDGTINVTAFVDEDDMSSDSATLVPTQQSVKAYVDSQVTAQDLDFQADTGGALSIDLDSETLTFTGGTGIDTSGLGNAVTFAIDSTVATLTGTQTLTNKTLTSPDVNTPDIDGGTIDGTVIGGTTPAAVSATTVSATGNITVGGTVDGRDVATDGTKLDGIEAGADVTDTANVTAAGALMDSELTSEASVKALNQGVATTDSPTFAGATVNGTVTADGLTVDGAGTINNTASGVVTALSLKNNTAGANNRTAIDLFSASTKYVTLEGGYGASAPVFNLKVGNPPKLVMSADGNGDISFYEDTGTTAKLTWDASAETLNFADNSKAIFGDSSDLQIYHDSSNGTSVITESGGGDLLVRGSNLRLQSPTGDNYFVAINGGASNVYHGGSVKLATTSTGVDVTGTVNADKITTDSNVDAASFTSAGSTYVDLNNGTVTGRLQTISSDFFIGTATTGCSLAFKSGNGVERLRINSIGDISFYEDTGTTAKFFWDASAESLGIGTSLPTSQLHLSKAGGTLIKLGTSQNTSEIEARESGAANLLVFSSNNSVDHMAIDSSGNVGIGISSPNYKLDVSGNANINGGTLAINAKSFANITGGNSFNIGGISNSGVQTLTFFTNTSGNVATERMRIDSSGNVGIGTSSPDALLEVAGTTNDSLFNLTGAGTNFELRATSGNGATANSSVYRLALDYLNGTYTNGFIDFYRGAAGNDGYLAFGSTGTERMRIDSSGNVGIGASPDALLRVNGTAKIGEGVASNTAKLMVNTASGVAAGIQLFQDGNESWIIQNPASTTALTFANSGSERMRIDSSGRLLVGTSSFGYAGVDLTVGSTSDSQNGIAIQTSTTGYGYVLFGDGTGTDAYVGQITYKHNDNYMAFNTAGAEAMRIDSSGNLLVGRTGTSGLGKLNVEGGADFTGGDVYICRDSGNVLVGTTDESVHIGTTSGAVLRSDGFGFFAVSGNSPIYANRLTNDGAIIDLRKDGAQVGSIGTTGGDLMIGTGDVNIRFDDGTDAIVPRNSGGSGRDAAVDIGLSTVRFKDLYLSGGAYLGGTGSANKLDDYEEGTWTPIVRGSGTNGSYTYSNGLGVYTKVGRQVTLSFYLGDITEVTAGTGYLQIHGCPFTKGSSQFFAGSVTLQSINWNNANSYGLLEFTSSSATSTLYVRLNGDNSSGSDLQISELISGSSDIGGTITFFV